MSTKMRSASSTYQTKVEALGTKAFGENFAGAYEMIMGERDVHVTSPEEFFYHETRAQGKLTPEQEKARREFLIAQENLFLDFYRKNMGIFSAKGIGEALAKLEGRDIDREVLENTFPRSPSIDEALRGKKGILHKEITPKRYLGKSTL